MKKNDNILPLRSDEDGSHVGKKSLKHNKLSRGATAFACRIGAYMAVKSDIVRL